MNITHTILLGLVILFLGYYFSNLKKKLEDRDDYEAKDTKKWFKALFPIHYKLL